MALNVLWVSNTLFPDAAEHLGMPTPIFGGWMYGLARDLACRTEGVQLAVATYADVPAFRDFCIKGIRYYLIPLGVPENVQEKCWSEIVSTHTPDLVHIHGTEFEYGLMLMRSFPKLRYVVSVQGLVALCYRYYLHGLSFLDVIASVTIRDLIRRDTLFQAKRKFLRRSEVEREYIARATVVLGRTDWDRAHVVAMRPSVVYMHCNESLRDPFYGTKLWLRSSCDSFSIFLSQASYPLKGLHQVLKALPFVAAKFPSVKLRIAGPDFISAKGLGARLRLGGYARYVRKLIKKLALEEYVTFLGPLGAEAMRDEYLRAHVFVCPSSIENSPNSLGEAQLLGVPVVSSYCGGVPSMVTDGVSALLYRFEEPEMLAERVTSIFSSDSLADRLSMAGRREAGIRHDRVKNVEVLEKAYSETYCRAMAD